MKIGIDMRMVGTRHGGIGRYVFELVKNIVQDDGGNKYTLFFNSKLTDPAIIQQLSSYSHVQPVLSQARHYSLAEQTSFLRLLNKHSVDLMHFPNFNVPLFYNKPFVVTIHDVVHHRLGGAKKSHALHFFAYKKVIEHAALAARAVITVSETSKKDIASVLNVPNKNIQVIYEGPAPLPAIDQEYVEQVKRSYLLKHPYFLFVGVLERKKNVVALCRAFDIFLSRYKLDINLVIVGKADPHYPDIKHHALDIPHTDRLIFTGYVEDRELAALYQGAYAYVNASSNEGFGLPGVEAMQYGLPLLVSNSPVFNEIYDNAAVYFDPENLEDIAEKMHLLSRDSQFYDQMRRNSLSRGTLFSWKKAAKETLAVYNSAL